MTAFILTCMFGSVSSGSIYFRNVRDCTYYSEELSGQQLQTENGIKTYKCMCKLVPKVNPKRVRVY